MTGLVDDLLGGPAIVVTIDGNEVTGDQLGPVRITYGRQEPLRRPEASTCSFALYADALPELPEAGAPVTVDLTDEAVTFLSLDPGAVPRFRGTITDLAHGGGQRPVLALVATSKRGRILRRPAVDVGEVVDSAGNLLAEILTDTSLDPLDLELGTLMDEDPVVSTKDPYSNSPWPQLKTIGEQLEMLTASTRGELIETRDGTFTWQAATVRADDTPIYLELTADEALVGTQANKDLDGLVRSVRWTYGTPGPAGQSSSVDFNSGVGWDIGEDVTVVTITADSVEAAAAGRTGHSSGQISDYLAARANPAWRLPTLDVDVLRSLDDGGLEANPAWVDLPFDLTWDDVDPSMVWDTYSAWRRKAALLLRAELGALLALTGDHGLPLADERLWLEGWTETHTRDAWRLNLAVSDFALTAVST